MKVNRIKSFLSEDRNVKRILVLFFVLNITLRVVVGVLFGQMNTIYDELLHWNLSKSVFYHLGNLFRNNMISYKEVLYSIVISVSHYFGNTEMQYLVAVGINSVLMTSVIFPVYLMSKKFLNNTFQSFIIAVISVIIPEMAYTAMILQENLYYPLTIWFFYLFITIILGDQYNRRSMANLGLYVFIVSICKQMALSIAVGLILYYLLQFFFFDKENRKRCITGLIYFMTVFFGLKLIFGIVFDYANYITNMSTSKVTIIVVLAHMFNPYVLSRCIYPALTYLLLTILYMGVFPVILPLAYLKELKVKERNLLLLIGTIFISIVGVICLRIVPKEEFDQLSLRFHFRYVFFLTIPMLILFISVKGRIIMEKRMKKSLILLVAAYIWLLGYIGLIPAYASPFDCVASNILRFVFTSDLMARTLSILVPLGILLGFYILYKKKVKLLYALILIGFILTGVLSNYYTYSMYNTVKQYYVSTKEDTFILNSYFSDKPQEDRSSLLIISENESSSAYLELYLEHPDYFFCTMDDFKKFTENYSGEPFTKLKLKSYLVEFTDADFTYPAYIISRERIHISGYKEVYLKLKQFFIYERVEDSK